MSGRAPMDRVALVARAQTDLDDRAPAVGCHVNFGIPPSPGDADGPGAPFSVPRSRAGGPSRPWGPWRAHATIITQNLNR